MANVVISNQVLSKNNQYYGWPNNPLGLSGEALDVLDLLPQGPYWVTPYIDINNNLDVAYQAASTVSDSDRPSPASCKVFRLVSRTTGIVTQIAITDADCIGSTNAYAAACDDLSGSVPTMPTVVIPIPVISVPPATTVAGVSKTFYIPLPDNANALDYKLNYAQVYPFINGVYSGIAFPTTYTHPAALVAELQTLYGAAYNATFTLVSAVISLSPATTSYSIKVVSTVAGGGSQINTLGFPIVLTPKLYTATIPSYLTPVSVNGIKINGVNGLFPIGGLVVGTANMSSLITALRPMFEPTAVFAIASGNTITVRTVQVPTFLTIDGVNTAYTFAP